MKLVKIEAWQDPDTGEIYGSRKEALSDMLAVILSEACGGTEQGQGSIPRLADQLVDNPAIRQQVKAILDELS
jgi:hypothetical protein